MYSVYALVDPLTDEVRYIGLTCNVNRRYSEHVSNCDPSNQDKRSWIDSLKLQGLCPKLIILEGNLEKKRGLRREKYWLQAHVEMDATLTNMRDAEMPYPECRILPLPTKE